MFTGAVTLSRSLRRVLLRLLLCLGCRLLVLLRVVVVFYICTALLGWSLAFFGCFRGMRLLLLLAFMLRLLRLLCFRLGLRFGR